MKRLVLHKRRGGYTLLELTLSIAFYTVIVTIALVGFVGIFGIYNKAQSLTRTQEEARRGIDALSRDLRLANSAVLETGPIPNILKYYCLSIGTNNIGYGLKDLGSNVYALVRANSCDSAGFTNATLVTSSDVWVERTPLWSTTPVDQSPFVISQVETATNGPKVWQVRLGVFRGLSAPGKSNFVIGADMFGAGTVLQSLVVSNGE
jgi:type II secretory pathway pseudopilin PulG